jgi:glycosyltransferase involved in cell wall biosynthesis
MQSPDLRRRPGVSPAPGPEQDHRPDGVVGDAQALAGLEPWGSDDLELDELSVPAADAVDSLGAEADLAPELTDCEWAVWHDGEAPRPSTADRGRRELDPRSSIREEANLATAGVVYECEISRGVDPIAPGAEGRPGLVLVRLFTEPLGMLSLTVPAKGMSAAQLAGQITAELAPKFEARLRECGLEWTGKLPLDGLTPPRVPAFVAGRRPTLVDGPEITVAVCTRDRTSDLERLLESLCHQRYERLRILVVDNAPSDDSTRDLASGFECPFPLEYVREPRPGLSWARNRAIESSRSEVIAWADDDEVCDPWWAAELARGFVEVPAADAVTGMVAPAELQTRCQEWFEQYSGVLRGRGFDRAVFSPATARLQSPLYPLPPYGAGANMAFRREALERIGRFDTALGTGTSTLAGEDTAALCSVLLSGGTVVYQPSAIVHHRHRRDYASLERVMLGYGRGLSAYYASMIARHPRCVIELLRLSRQAMRDQLSGRGRRAADLEGFPPKLLRHNRKGLLQGAFMYPGARLRARRLATAGS